MWQISRIYLYSFEKKWKKPKIHFFFINFGDYTYFWLKTTRIVLEKFQKQIWVSKKMTIRLIYHLILKSKIFLKFFFGKKFFRGATISIWIYPKWSIFILKIIYILKAEVKIFQNLKKNRKSVYIPINYAVLKKTANT